LDRFYYRIFALINVFRGKNSELANGEIAKWITMLLLPTSLFCDLSISHLCFIGAAAKWRNGEIAKWLKKRVHRRCLSHFANSPFGTI
jgi:hypothetical protein